MRWVNSTDLDAWADRLDSRSRMPEVIRRLIHATVELPRKVDFPCEESIQLGGWDGIAEVEESHVYVPVGYSGWELGSSQDVKSKADDDYESRTKNPGVLEPTKTTFVFVTPRRWGNKEKWAEARRAEGHWADVRAYDADDIEQWLELAPAVGAWLAVVIGKYPPGIQSLTDFWSEFSSSTTPAIPKELIVAGRNTAVETVKKWLAVPATALTIEADAPIEAVAFCAAVLLALSDSEAEHWISRAVVTRETSILRQLGSERNPLLIVWLSDDESAVGAALAAGHRVLIPTGHGQPGAPSKEDVGVIIKLARIPTVEFVKVMVSAGLSQGRAEFLSRETARSVPVLRRQIPASGRPAVPTWATPANAPSLKPILLAGSWLSANPSDREVLKELGATDYDQIEAVAARWALESEAPVQRIGGEWSLISPVDAWHVLARCLTARDMERLLDMAMKVLSIEDPALELAPADRWLSGVYNKKLPHSRSLRTGLAQTLCLLAGVAQGIGISAEEQPQTYVDRIVWSLLGDRPGWKRWYSLSDLLPLLAEASPESFLRALEDELIEPTSEIMHLFNEEGMMGHSAHTGLLWALETLAWFPAYLGRVTMLLGKLAHLDPGGRLANRPRKSLREIFLTWRPQTGASWEQRMQALDLVVARIPDVGWNLLMDLLPKGHDFTSPTSEPRWREKPEVKPTTDGEHYMCVKSVIDKIGAVAGSDPNKLKVIVPAMATFPPSSRAELLTKLSEYAENYDESPQRVELWNSLRELVNRHRQFVGANWTLAEEELRKIDPLVDRLRPKDEVKKSEWLFNDWHPAMPHGASDHAAVEAEIASLRISAVAEVYGKGGVDALCLIAGAVKYPAFVGYASAGLPEASSFTKELLVKTLGVESLPLRTLGVAFVRRLIQARSRKWADELLRTESQEWSAAAKADFLLAMPGGQLTWTEVDSAGAEVQRLYWTQIQPFDLPTSEPNELAVGLSRFLDYGRALEGLEIAAYRAGALPSPLLIKILDEAANSLSSAAVRNLNSTIEFELDQVFGILRSRNDVAESDLIRLEWCYLPLLGHGDEKHAETLHSVLARDPPSFAQLIRWSFRPRGQAAEADSEQPITELDQHRARHAYDLLSSCRGVPGMREDGTVDAAELNKWVDNARALCSKSGHARIGDQQIGHLLASCPPDSDGVWPIRAVRDLIERVESRDLEVGLEISVANQRGVISRNLTEGGGQERTLAQTYREWADQTASAWPRTSAMLRSLERQYEREGRREDDTSQRWDIRS